MIRRAPIRDYETISELLRGVREIDGATEAMYRGLVYDAGERLLADRGSWVLSQLIRDFAANDDDAGRLLAEAWAPLMGEAA